MIEAQLNNQVNALDAARELDLVVRLRKVVSDMSVVEAMELLRSRLAKVALATDGG